MFSDIFCLDGLFPVDPPPKPHPPPHHDGGSGGGSGGSGSGGSGSGGSGGGSNSALSSDEMRAKAKKSLAVMLSIAAVAGMAIAAVAIPRREVRTENNHPLKGSLTKRIALFSNLAKHASMRPPRRNEDGRYINADDIQVV